MEIIERKKDELQVKMLSPLIWAYIGDSVFELYVRTELINKTKLKPHKLHIEAIKYVKASAQANILKKIKDKLTLLEEEGIRKIIIWLKMLQYKNICIQLHLKD